MNILDCFIMFDHVDINSNTSDDTDVVNRKTEFEVDKESDSFNYSQMISDHYESSSINDLSTNSKGMCFWCGEKNCKCFNFDATSESFSS